MNVLVRRLALLMLAGLMMVVWTPLALGLENESFGLTPHPDRKDGNDRFSFSMPLEPGATFEDAVRIYNRTDQPLNLAVYAADAEAGPDEVLSVGFRTSHPKGVGSWIDLSRTDIQLAPRAEVIVSFRVRVKTSEPSPSLGAIVVENTASGLATKDSQRLYLKVLTNAPNTPTTSVRVRPLLLRSPWIVLAMLGLIVAIILVWVGARRAKRPKDIVVESGEIESADLAEAPEASLPVIKRLGETRRETTMTSVLDRPLLDDAMLVEVDPDDEEGSSEIEFEDFDAASDGDDFDEGYEEEEEEDEDLPPARSRPAPRKAKAPAKRATAPKKKVAARKPAAKRKPAPRSSKKKAAAPARKKAASNFIPLDEL